ncbi:MAG TPA: cyanophycin synthetase [Clostridiaceae bacterium]|nr:cyanophycin synthetase [Clostridiaceae bacterium]
MQIYSIQSFTGKNIYSHKPVIKMIIDVEDMHNTPTKDIDGFNGKLVNMFPGLKKHYCSLGVEGGFAKRLEEGTYAAHVIEHLVLELQSIIGYDVYFGRTRLLKEPSTYYIVYEYMNEKVGIECGRAAANIIDSLIRGKEIDVGTVINDLKKTAVESEMGPSTRAIYEEAKKRGIPVVRLGNDSLIQLGYGKYSRLIEASLTDAARCISVDIAGNKQLTKQILMDNDIPVPYGDIAYTEQSAIALAEYIGYPVVVKPYDGNQGKGVALNLSTREQVREAFTEAIKFSKAVIVEKYIKGRDYRVLVVGDKVSAVSERRPPCVIGDGIHTIKELVEAENNNDLRGEDHEKPLTKIHLDSVARLSLSRRGIDENYIPAPNEEVYLRDNGNLSTGGTARDCSRDIHPYNAYLAVKAAKLIGLDIAGVDITAEDISVPICGGSGAVIEVNAAPGLRMHLYPTEGQANNVAANILDMMFPEGSPCSIPIVSITGTNGKTTTARLVRHVLMLTGKKVGMTSTSGIYIGNECIQKGDCTGPVSARLVLSNKEVEAAVLETARGGIIRKGLGYEEADVGVITNITEDHLGIDGINTLEDLAFVKSLVIEAVKPDGYAVLNADDEMTNWVIRRASCNIILFSKNRNNLLVLEHIRRGGKAVYIDKNTIFIHENGNDIPLIAVGDIPITARGILKCNVENSLAAISALYSLNVPVEIIRKGLKTFKPDLRTNPGRFNIFDMGDFKVMLDYGHNPAGYRAVVDYVKKIKASRLVGIIGIPGDRMDKHIEEVGELCGKVFSKVYIKEDDDLRGRSSGEVAGILYNALIRGGMGKECIEIIYSEQKALETALHDAQPGDLVVMFYEKFEPALEIVERFKEEIEKNPPHSRVKLKETAG